MQKHYKNCLYIHGLHSTVNPDKINILEKYFKRTTAQHIDYIQQKNAFQLLEKICVSEQVDFIVGSSFGGYLGFHLSRKLQLPGIIYNPALFFGKEDKVFIPNKPTNPSPSLLAVIGEQDDVVPPESTKKFIKNNKIGDNLHTISCSWLGHIIDLNTFEVMLQNSLNLAYHKPIIKN